MKTILYFQGKEPSTEYRDYPFVLPDGMLVSRNGVPFRVLNVELRMFPNQPLSDYMEVGLTDDMNTYPLSKIKG